MGILEEIFSERLPLGDGMGHADVLISDNVDPTGKSFQKSAAAPKTYYTSGVHSTHPPPPRQTVDSKPDKKGRERCFNQGQFVPCQSVRKRGLSGVAPPTKHIKALRAKYGKSK